MLGYYTVHNLETLQWGMTPHSTSTKVAVVAGTKPSKTAYPRMYENIAIVAGSLVTATASFFIWQFLWPNPKIEVYD